MTSKARTRALLPELQSKVQAELPHIPRGNVTQNVLREIYTQRRQDDLARSPSAPSHATLMASIATVQRTVPSFRPLYDAHYFEVAA